jgi:antitoxin (DNA-binding transcriptional repressor) of toxin-antitoxin stability system
VRTVSIRTVQHQLASMIAEVEKGAEIVNTRHRRPVARLSPIARGSAPAAPSPAAIRRYWRARPMPPAVKSSVSNAELISAGRGDL